MKKNLHLSGHISKRYNEELEEVRTLIESMGNLVVQQVKQGLESLVYIDTELAKQVIANDEKVNDLEIKIDEQCTHILATRQPAASDLRLLVSIIKTITHIERIGDEATKLSKSALTIAETVEEPRKYKELKYLGELVAKNLEQSIKAYATLDVQGALDVIENDKDINEEFDNVSRLLLLKMMEDPREIKNGLGIMWCARALERMGDHAKNVAEYLIFLVEGKEVRHTDIDEMKQILVDS